MFYLPCGIPYYGFLPARVQNSYIRVLHASPDAPAVDIYANGNPIARSLAYRGFTPYMSVPAGSYNIEVYPAGTKTNPVLRTNVEIPPQSILTIAAAGRVASLRLIPFTEPIMAIPAGKAYVRFVHLSPNAPRVDITLPDGTPLFRNVGFGQATSYIPVDPGTYTLQARPAGTSNVVLTVPNIHLSAGKFFSVYAIGLAGESPPLQVLIPLDGNTYLKL